MSKTKDLLKINMGPFIKTEMNRCIHCTRYVRFSTEVSGSDEMVYFGRGRDMEITTYLDIAVKSELSGNVIDYACWRFNIKSICILCYCLGA